jgi:hypothetical protein
MDVPASMKTNATCYTQLVPDRPWRQINWYRCLSLACNAFRTSARLRASSARCAWGNKYLGCPSCPVRVPLLLGPVSHATPDPPVLLETSVRTRARRRPNVQTTTYDERGPRSASPCQQGLGGTPPGAKGSASGGRRLPALPCPAQAAVVRSQSQLPRARRA